MCVCLCARACVYTRMCINKTGALDTGIKTLHIFGFFFKHKRRELVEGASKKNKRALRSPRLWHNVLNSLSAVYLLFDQG